MNNAEKLNDVFQLIRKNFYAIYELDLIQNRYELIYLDDAEDESRYPVSGFLTDVYEKTKVRFIDDSYQEAFGRFCQGQNFLGRLREENYLEFEYENYMTASKYRRIVIRISEEEDNSVKKLCAMVSDIEKGRTEQLRQQAALLDAYKYSEAVYAQKSDMLARVSHDIRTPMNAIIGMTAIAKKNINNTDKLWDCLNKTEVASKHLLELINDVLDLNHIETGKFELDEDEINLAELVESISDMARPLSENRKQHMSLSLDGVVHENVVGDSTRIKQIFINIISNSIKYTPEGGHISISVTEKPMEMGGYDAYTVVCEDDGIGMSPEFVKKLFDPFSRSDDDRVNEISGNGLGMSIVQNLVRYMEGDIQVESELNKGTKITVTIPLRLQAGKRRDYEKFRDKKVLVIHEKSRSYERLKNLLDEFELEAVSCENLEVAFYVCLDDSDYLAVLVSDEIVGSEFDADLGKISDMLEHRVPIFLLTSLNVEAQTKRLEDIGVDGVLTRPVFKTSLYKKLVQSLHEKNDEKMQDNIFTHNHNFTDKRVLLVEDNEMNGEITLDILSITGVQTEWAHDGQEAVTLVEKNDVGYYNLILMDIQMPVLDGYGATVAIRNMQRQDARDIPIVALSANVFQTDVARARSIGMNDHMSKPIVFSKLEEILVKYLG